MSGLRLLKGALAGCIATGPMTVAMLLMHRLLPREHRYELPPMIIARRLAGGKGPLARLGTREHKGLTFLLHFGFGTSFGAVYGLIPRQAPLPPAVRGILWAMCIWVGSYLGWIPALDIMPKADKHPAQRNLLMIIAHVLWGAVLGVLLDRLDGDESSQREHPYDQGQEGTEHDTAPKPASESTGATATATAPAAGPAAEPAGSAGSAGSTEAFAAAPASEPAAGDRVGDDPAPGGGGSDLPGEWQTPG